MKKVYVFTCKVNSKIHGFTFEKVGANFPTNNICAGKWIYSKEITISPETEGLIGADAKTILAAIEKNHYYIVGVQVLFTEEVINK